MKEATTRPQEPVVDYSSFHLAFGRNCDGELIFDTYLNRWILVPVENGGRED